MKKAFTLITTIILSIAAIAQQIPAIPNGGFEIWTSPFAPDNWGTIASAYGGAAGGTLAEKDTTSGNHIQGLASLRLYNDTVPLAGMNLIGQCGLGVTTAANGLTFVGYPYTKRPDSILFAYKYTPGPGAATDTAVMLLNIKKAGASLIGGERLIALTNTNGQFITAVVSLSSLYTGSGTPDTLFLSFASGNLQSSSVIVGSKLWIDSVRFGDTINVVTGIEQLSSDIKGINVYPNPANAQINIAIGADEVGSQIQLFDLSGREVYSGILTNPTYTIDTKSLETGVYSIRVNSIDKLTTYKGRLTVTH